MSPTLESFSSPSKDIKKRGEREVRTTLRVHCGCECNFETIQEGQDHALSTGHTLRIAGLIRSSGA